MRQAGSPSGHDCRSMYSSACVSGRHSQRKQRGRRDQPKRHAERPVDKLSEEADCYESENFEGHERDRATYGDAASVISTASLCRVPDSEMGLPAPIEGRPLEGWWAASSASTHDNSRTASIWCTR